MLIHLDFDEDAPVQGVAFPVVAGRPYHNCKLTLDRGVCITATPRGLQRIVEEASRLLAEVQMIDAHLPPRPSEHDQRREFVAFAERMRVTRRESANA